MNYGSVYKLYAILVVTSMVFCDKTLLFLWDHKSVLSWHTCMDWFVYWHTFSYTNQHVGVV